MAQVRTFHLTPNDVGINSETFVIDGIAFRETLAEMINTCEREVKSLHKTCQCIPVFKLRTGGSVSYDTKFFNGECLKVIVILTF